MKKSMKSLMLVLCAAFCFTMTAACDVVDDVAGAGPEATPTSDVTKTVSELNNCPWGLVQYFFPCASAMSTKGLCFRESTCGVPPNTYACVVQVTGCNYRWISYEPQTHVETRECVQSCP